MDAKLTAILSAKVDAFLSGFNQATTKLQQFGQQAQTVGTAASVALSVPLGLLGKKALEAAGDMDALRRGLATVEKDATTLGKRLTALAEIAKMPGLGLAEAFKTDLSLRTTLGPLVGYEKAVNLATRAIKAFGNANASVGGGKADFGAAMLQMQQIVSQGKIQGDELNVLASRIPQVRTAILAAFGTADTQLINSKNNAAQIVEKITAELEKLPKATGGIKNAFENFSDFSTQALDRVGTNIAKNFNLTGIVDSLTSTIDKLITKFESLSPTTQKIIIGLAGIAVIVPPIIAAIGLIGPALTAGFAILGAITAPLAAVVVGVGVAAAAIVSHWDKVKAALVDSGAWQTLSRIVNAGLSGVTSVFGVFANLIQGDWSNLWIHLKNIVFSAASAIMQVWADAATGILNVLDYMLPGNVLDPLKNGIKWLADEANKAIQPVTGLKDAAKGLFDGFNFGGDIPLLKGLEKGAKGAKFSLDEYKKSLQDTIDFIKSFGSTGLGITSGIITGPMANKGLPQKASFEGGQLKMSTSMGVSGGVDALTGRMQLPNGADMVSAALNKGLEEKLAYVDAILQEKLDGLKDTISTSLQGAAQAGIEGMANLIGGLVSGAKGLATLPQLFGGILSGLAKQIGQAMIKFGTAGIAIKKLSLNPYLAIAAGAGLIALSAALSASVQKSTNSVKLAKGGLAYGPTLATVGDNVGAQYNPEVVKDASSLMGMISKAVGNGGGGASVARVRGGDLYIANHRAVKFENTLRS